MTVRIIKIEVNLREEVADATRQSEPREATPEDDTSCRAKVQRRRNFPAATDLQCQIAKAAKVQ